MSGKFQLSREIFEHSIWQNPAEFRLFVYLIGKAMFSDGVNVGDYKLNKGQYLRSYRKLRDDLMYIENNEIKHYSLGTVKNLVDKLVRDGRIETLKTELGTLFTVVNYAQYQGFTQKETKALNSICTASEQPLNNNKNAIKDKTKDIHIEIFNYWLVKDIIRHKSITHEMELVIDKALKKYTKEQIKDAIDLYSEAYHSDYYYDYKHTLENFLKQSNGINDWLEEGSKYENYMDYKYKNKNDNKSKSNWEVDAS